MPSDEALGPKLHICLALVNQWLGTEISPGQRLHQPPGLLTAQPVCSPTGWLGIGKGGRARHQFDPLTNATPVRRDCLDGAHRHCPIERGTSMLPTEEDI